MQAYQGPDAFPYSPMSGSARPELTICITSCETPMPHVPHSTLHTHVLPSSPAYQQPQPQQHTPLTHQQLQHHNNSYMQQQPLPQQHFTAVSSRSSPPGHSSLPYNKSSSPLNHRMYATGITPDTRAFSLSAEQLYASREAYLPQQQQQQSQQLLASYDHPVVPTTGFSALPRVQRPKRRHDEVRAMTTCP